MRETQTPNTLFFASAYPGTVLWDQVIEAGKIADVEGYLDQLNDAADFVANFTSMEDKQLLETHRGAMKEIDEILNQLEYGTGLNRAFKRLMNSLHDRGIATTLILAVRRVFEFMGTDVGSKTE